MIFFSEFFTQGDEYGWWFSSTDHPAFSSLQDSEIDNGHADSVELIEKTVKEQVFAFQYFQYSYHKGSILLFSLALLSGTICLVYFDRNCSSALFNY